MPDLSTLRYIDPRVIHHADRRDRHRRRARATRSRILRAWHLSCAERCDVQRKEAIVAQFVREGHALRAGGRHAR